MVTSRAIGFISRSKSLFIRKCLGSMVLAASLLFMATTAVVVEPDYAQETTGGLQGTVKDPSGAVVPNASLMLTSPTLVGNKESTTDSKGYFRFSNLPPGEYSLKVNAAGFETLVRSKMDIEVGHLPSLDLTLTVGGATSVVEVSAEAPLIDATTNTTLTNIPEDVIEDVPHGRSFQSVIQFAPSARNEPLMGSNRASNGTGGVSPGNGSNGNAYGFSVAGGSDSENSYLVEGQETANLIGGYSHTNVPFDFIQEVQIKSSGIEAEHGGSLGGVVNVIMQKGSTNYHGAVFGQFENQALDGHPVAFSRYDPTDAGTSTTWGFVDPGYQNYQPRQPKTSDVFPGFRIGGPLLPPMIFHDKFARMRDKLFFFGGFNPELADEERKIVESSGIVPFSRNTQTYYTTARIDASITDKIRVFGSWLYQYQRQSGQNLPSWDAIQGYVNPAASNPTFVYGHNLGYAAPNITVNTGADITITHSLVSTSRFGYYFENYHDFGFPTNAQIYNWATDGVGATDTTGATLPSNLEQLNGYLNAATDQNFTSFNASKGIQFDQDVAWYKSGWAGTHNFKFGYQLNRLSNTLVQHYNEPYVQVYVGDSAATNYSPQTSEGATTCAVLSAANKTDVNKDGNCQGQFGYVIIQDFGTNGHATSYNHGLFAQDSWTLGHGLTINAGIRFDKEFLPGESEAAGAPAKPINFNWTDKVAPRLGAAWDVLNKGKMKVFGSYGEFYDQMKLNLAISSFGGQYWDNCVYALNTANYQTITPTFGSDGRYCGSEGDTQQANFAGGAAPAGLSFIENVNFRAFPTTCSTCSASQEGVAPGLKPYKQHEAVFGVDYQLSPLVAVEARYDRRRLDHVIEDSAIYGVGEGETFVVVNPGQGVNSSFLGFCSFLYGASQLAKGGACNSSDGYYPPDKIIPAARSYDGLEIRVTKSISHNWYGTASYTYSHFRGNYTGLTSSDIADGGLGGRNSPNNSRSFDEPYFSYNSMGGSSSGPLPTDRPNVFKGDGYYQFKYLKKFNTNLGLFQTIYQGSPNTSYMDIGLGGSGWPVDVVNRGKWVDVSQDPISGAITLGNARTNRNKKYIQSDFNLEQGYKIAESKALNFSATFTNLLNQHTVTAINEQIDTGYAYQFGTPGGQDVLNGVAFYASAMHPYVLKDILTHQNSQGGPITVNSQYGKPLYYQAARQIRLGVHFTF